MQTRRLKGNPLTYAIAHLFVGTKLDDSLGQRIWWNSLFHRTPVTRLNSPLSSPNEK